MRIESLTVMPLSAMAVVFADQKPRKSDKCSKLTVLSNETASFQLAFCISEKGDVGAKFELCIESEIEKYITPYVVGNVGVTKIGYGFSDDWFLRKKAGLYPDYLRKIKNGSTIYAAKEIWQSIFFNLNEDAADIPEGTYNVKVTLKSCHEDKTEVSENFCVKVLGSKLPKQSLTVTNWIHYDCMSYFASCKPFSQKFWKVFRSYVTLAVKNGQNMILTPAFTPPLDTAVGKERPTVQLVDVEKTDSGYKFDFTLMEKFIKTALECGVEKFEHSHMFTQWGAYHAPKIVVRENGRKIKKFGWHTDAHGEEYEEFVRCYIGAAVKFLLGKGWLDKFFFHVSDEPVPENRESYAKASKLMHELLGELPSGDALSKVQFFEDGIVKTPIAKSRDIEDFFGKCDNLWLYFTGAESKDFLSNRLIGMPVERHRILGLQLYYYDIKGFLQWAFNAHHTTLCENFVNPYSSSDNNMHFVGGTSYLVYPEVDGATPSLRLMYFRDLMQDVRVCQLLESMTDRKFVMSIIDEIIPNFGVKCKVTSEQISEVRGRINAEIEKRTH